MQDLMPMLSISSKFYFGLIPRYHYEKIIHFKFADQLCSIQEF